MIATAPKRPTRRCVTPRQRRYIYNRHFGYCGICGLEVAFADMVIDHVLPVSRGGADELGNMQPAHALCNHRKANLPKGIPYMAQLSVPLSADSAAILEALREQDHLPLSSLIAQALAAYAIKRRLKARPYEPPAVPAKEL